MIVTVIIGLAAFALIVAVGLADWWFRGRHFGRASTTTESVVTAKPRVRISQDGWVRNASGKFPFDPACHVELVFDDARPILAPYTERADFWHESWWKREANSTGRNIAFYRISRSPQICSTPPRIPR